MNTAIIVALIGTVSGFCALVLGVINLVAGRGGRRADEAQKLTGSAMEILDDVQAQCDKCTDALRDVKKVLRALIRAVKTGDQAVSDSVADEALDLLDSMG